MSRIGVSAVPDRSLLSAPSSTQTRLRNNTSFWSKGSNSFALIADIGECLNSRIDTETALRSRTKPGATSRQGGLTPRKNGSSKTIDEQACRFAGRWPAETSTTSVHVAKLCRNGLQACQVQRGGNGEFQLFRPASFFSRVSTASRLFSSACPFPSRDRRDSCFTTSRMKTPLTRSLAP